MKQKKDGEDEKDDAKATRNDTKGAENDSTKKGLKEPLLANQGQINESTKQEIVTIRNQTVLKNMNITFEKGKLICIIGDVGSGKSSLMSALLGDLQFLDKSFIEKEQDKDIESEEVKKRIRA